MKKRKKTKTWQNENFALPKELADAIAKEFPNSSRYPVEVIECKTKGEVTPPIKQLSIWNKTQ